MGRNRWRWLEIDGDGRRICGDDWIGGYVRRIDGDGRRIGGDGRRIGRDG